MASKNEELTVLDLNPEHGVDIIIDGRVLWVNVDGMCRLRASKLKYIEVTADGNQKFERHIIDK